MIKPGHFKDPTKGVLRKILTVVLFLQRIFRDQNARVNVASNYEAQIQNAPKLKLRKRPLIFSFALFVAIVFTGYAVYKGDKKLNRSEHAVRNAEQVIHQGTDMLSLTREVEMALQLFVITNNHSFIKPLYTSEKNSRLYLVQLQKLTKDNAAQQRRVDSLSFYMRGLWASAYQMVEVKRITALDSITNFFSKGNGKSAISQVRNITNVIQLEENTLLKQRREMNMESHSAFKRLAAFLVFLIVLLTISLLVTSFPYLLQLTYANHIKQLSYQLEKKLADHSANMSKYQYFFYNTVDLACFANTEGYFEELNGNFLKVLGYTKKQLQEKKFSEYIHPDDLRPTLKMVSRLSSGVNVVNFTNRYKTKFNTYKDLEWNATFNPETKKVYAIARDVTGQMAAKREVAFQNEEKEKRAAELTIANKELGFNNKEKEKRAAELIVANKELAFQNKEKEKRAAELTIANKELGFNNKDKDKRAAELIIANKELAFQNEEKEKRAAELTIANKELGFQNKEKEKRAAELIVANKELAFQNEEKEKRAAELTIANKELGFNNKDKEKRAAELIIANKELAFQNKEKEKRAAELTIANKELGFQNEEKEKRAAELIVANKELAFQNEEKEKRAAELTIANKELGFNNKDKEKRAAELIIANKELAFQNEEIEKLATELTVANKEMAVQNEEKEKSAAELIIANNELVFQHQEKEKRAEELAIANKELVFQNEEKEKRAIELVIANEELVFQHKEKEKRAEELAIANKELVFQNEEKEKRAIELVVANKELKKAEDDIRKLNEELEQKVNKRTRELELANKELESFSYSVSHDLRAPLRAVHGYATMLHEDYGTRLDSEAGRLMGNVISNSKKMGQLIDDLLAFSRLGRKELVKMNVPMLEIATNVCTEIKGEQVNRIIHFDISELHPAQGDVVALKQVWVNLISNAVKYSKLNKNALIEIRSELKVNEVIYSIKDNGAGFDMRYAKKLFNVFQRLHNEETFEGTGVGLAIVHRIISKHGGRVWAESKVDLGAKFYFSLPKTI